MWHTRRTFYVKTQISLQPKLSLIFEGFYRCHRRLVVSLAYVDIVCSDPVEECQDAESSQLLLLEAVLIQAHVHRKVSGGLSCFPWHTKLGEGRVHVHSYSSARPVKPDSHNSWGYMKHRYPQLNSHDPNPSHIPANSESTQNENILFGVSHISKSRYT